MNFIKQLYSRKFIFYIFFLFTITLIFPQRKEHSEENPNRKPIYFETHIIPYDSLFTCFVSFKIPFNNLLFIRENRKFKSGLSITYEIFKDNEFIYRVYERKTISIAEFKKTNDKNLFFEGITSFNLKEGEYKISPVVLLDNSDIVLKKRPIKLLVDSIQISRPLVVLNNSIDDSLNVELVNLGNKIPFSNDEYDLLIPIYDDYSELLRVIVKQNEKTIIKKEITEYELFNNKLVEYNNKIILNRNNLELIKYFRVNFINRNLIEGEAKIFVNTESSEYQFDINVFWNDKPKSLYDITSAIKALKIIGYNDAVDSLLDVSDNEQNRALLNFWNKFDSDKSTSYNELFTEFYSRIDYAKENFSSLRKDDGIKTDRERTFILFGKPDKIERTYTEVDNIVEIWTYNSLNEKIYFSDITGTGKFIRIK